MMNLNRCKRRMRSFGGLILLLLFAVHAGSGMRAYAQTSRPVTVKGKVVDSENHPVVGANVLIKNSTRGEVTGKDGSFEIKAVPTDVLVVSMIGYVPVEKPVGHATSFVITLKEDQMKIDDVVVIGYGEQRQKDVTGTISTVKMDDLAKAPVISFDQALQGRAAGVVISSNDGQPGSGMNIVIRGANSLTQSNSPLYVIDGFPMEDFVASSLNPADIASINILKDASATAIYGSRGANGVVIVETKSGKAGRAKVTYNGSYGFQTPSKMMELMNPYDYVKYITELIPNTGTTFFENQNRTLEDYRTVPGVDWQDMFFRTAAIQNHSVSVNGGNRQTRYAGSLSYSGQNGIIENSGYKRYQGRFRFDQEIARNLKVNLNFSYTSEKTSGSTISTEASSSNSYMSYMMYRVWTFRPVLLDGLTLDDSFEDDSSLGLLNPIKSNENESVNAIRNTLQANAKISWTILPGLTLNVSGGYFYRNLTDKRFYNHWTYAGYTGYGSTKGVNGLFNNAQMKQFLNENTINYTKTIKRKHVISAVGGFTLQSVTNESYGYKTQQIPWEGLGMSGIDNGVPYETSAAPSEYRMMSFLGRVNYSYRSKYLFTVSFRADGSSKFDHDNQWGYFPSGAFAWRLKNERFLRKSKVVSDAKIRVSWGRTGNNRVGSYASKGGVNITDTYSFDNATPSKGLSIREFDNPDLTWETTEQTDLGFDLSLFNDRIGITADVYRKTTRDLLLNTRIPYSSGLTTAMRNVGKVRNDGLEITLNTVNIKKRNFEWSSDFNIAFNRSKVLALADGQDYFFSYVNFTGDFNNTPLYITRVGGPMTSFFGVVHDGNYQVSDFDEIARNVYQLKPTIATNGSSRETIQPGYIKYVDQNGDRTINNDDRIVIGRALPIHTGGFNNNFRYENFTLNVFFQWSYGNMIMNANRLMLEGNAMHANINQFASYADRWTFENQDAPNFRAGGEGPRGIYSTRTLEDGSYLRLKTVQLAYHIPKPFLKKIKIESAKVYVSGQNLFTWTDYSGLDPEVSTKYTALTPGFDYSSYARNRIFMLGLQVNF